MNEPITIINDAIMGSKVEGNYLPEKHQVDVVGKLKKSKKTHKKLRVVNDPPTTEEPISLVSLNTQNTPNTPIQQLTIPITNLPFLFPPPPPPHTSSPPPLINKTRKNKKIISPNEKLQLWELFDIDNQVQSIEIGDIKEVNTTEKIPTLLMNNTTTDALPPDVSKTPNNPFRNIDPPQPSKESSISLLQKTPDSPLAEYPTTQLNKDEMYNIRHICQKCDSVLLIMEDGVPTCINPKCGIIYKDVIDYSPEWKFYGCGNGDNKHTTDITRCGNPINPLLIESSFGCKILCNNNSSFEMKRIRKWTEWTSTPHREKSLYEEFLFITTMAHNSGIPKIFIDYAMMIHKDISEQKMFRGMNRDGIKAASIYISCRLNGCPRTAHEIAEIFKLDKQSTTLGCSNAIKILNNIERNVEHSNKSEFKTTTASSFIERYCCKLGISQELTLLSKFIAIKTEQTELLCNNTPQSSAAGIIQFISQTFHLGISKMSIKTVCGVSEVTIGKCCKKMESIKDQLIPKSMMVKYGLS